MYDQPHGTLETLHCQKNLDLLDPVSVYCTVIASYLALHDVPIMDRSV